MDGFRPTDRRNSDPTYLADGRGSVSGGTLVGLTTKHGVLLAADTRTSRGSVIRSEDAEKITAVHPTAAMGSTDDLGTVQSFIRTIRSEVDRYETRRGEPMDMTALSTFAVGELRSRSSLEATFVLGGVGADGPHVFTLHPDEGALEDAYVTAGSGGQIAYGILDVEATGSLTMADARLLAGRAITTAAERDVETGVGFSVAEITDAGVDIHRYESFDELP